MVRGVSVSGSDTLDYRGLAEITTKESFLTNTVAGCLELHYIKGR
jgi:hypothetical protein